MKTNLIKSERGNILKKITTRVLLTVGLVVLENSAFAAIKFSDVTASSGLQAADKAADAEAKKIGFQGYLSWGHRIIWADIDGDDRVDLNVGRGPNILLKNNGDGTFADISKSSGYQQLHDDGHGGVMFDLDNDGDRDFFGADVLYKMVISRAQGIDVLARNNGTGKFEDITLNSPAISTGEATKSGHTRGVCAADFDNDGHLDLLAVVWEAAPEKLNSDDHIFWNDGKSNFKTLTRLSTTDNNQGCQTVDYDQDGDIDIYTNVRAGKNKLYRNDGNKKFTEVAVSLGLAFDDKETDDGSGWGDIDNDGDLDFIEPRHRTVYMNKGDGTFTRVDSVSAGLHKIQANDIRGAGFADFDGDGKLDLAISNKRGSNSLLKNTSTSVGNYLKIKLIRANGQLDAIGTFVSTYEAGHLGEKAFLVAMRYAEGATGYCTQHDPVLHFGLGKQTKVDIRVQFPGGSVIDKKNVDVNKAIEIKDLNWEEL